MQKTEIGDSIVMTFDSKEDWPETPAFIRLYVENCDATYQQALKRRRYFRDCSYQYAMG